jgi:hypothetical protein
MKKNSIKSYLKLVTVKVFTKRFDLSGHDQVVMFVCKETAVYLPGK